MLGRNLYNDFSKSYEVHGVGKSEFPPNGLINYDQMDLSNFKKLEDYLKNKKFDIVINAAAIIDHKYCEQNPASCYRINSELNLKIVQNLPPETKFIFISSDAVFSDKDLIRDEKGPTNPSSVYGISKLKAEKLIREASSNYVIIRTTILGFSPRKSSLTDWILKSLENEKPLNLFDDVLFNPITVWDLIKELELIIKDFKLYKNQILHLNGRECISKYMYGLSLAKSLNFSTKTITQSSLNDFQHKGKRVYNQCLNTGKYASLSKRALPDLNMTLNSIINNYKHDKNKVPFNRKR